MKKLLFVMLLLNFGFALAKPGIELQDTAEHNALLFQGVIPIAIPNQIVAAAQPQGFRLHRPSKLIATLVAIGATVTTVCMVNSAFKTRDGSIRALLCFGLQVPLGALGCAFQSLLQ